METNNTYPAVSLVNNIIICDRAYANHPSADDLGDVSVVWCMFRNDGTKVGGAYSTHAGAAATIREFPAYFAGTHIAPCIMRRAGYHSYVCDKVDHDLEPGIGW